MRREELYRQRGVLVRRAFLEPGEASGWHVDACHRVSVVVSGERLAVEYRDGSEALELELGPGMVGVDEPSSRVHRAVNVGGRRHEEVVTFLLDRPDQDPQPGSD